jgi:hypothetical protein
MRPRSQRRPQYLVVPQDQVSHLPPAIPARAEGEALLDGYKRKPSVSDRMLRLRKLSPSRGFHNSSAEGRELPPLGASEQVSAHGTTRTPPLRRHFARARAQHLLASRSRSHPGAHARRQGPPLALQPGRRRPCLLPSFLPLEEEPPPPCSARLRLQVGQIS